jgi:hypothetical protein
MPIVKLKEFKVRQVGIYVISPQAPEDNKISFKIGRTIQMNKRLNGYHLCFPDGFYIYKALMLNDTFKTQTKEEKKKSIDMTRKIEKFIHDDLDGIRFQSTTRTNHEWFVIDENITIQRISDALLKAHQHFKKETDYPIQKFREDFYGKFFIDDAEDYDIRKDLKIVKEPPKYMPQEGSRTRSGRVIKKNTKYKDSEYFDISK